MKLLSLVAVALLAACAHTRDVTPWLKVSVYHPVQILADSGSRVLVRKTLRRVDGDWQQIGDVDQALRVSSDRVLFATSQDGFVLATEGGANVGVQGCYGWPITSVPARQLICVYPKTTQRSQNDKVPDDGSMPVDLSRFDLDGRPLGVAHLGLPANAVALGNSLTLIGLIGDSVVIGVFDGATCTAWIAHGEQFVRGGHIAVATVPGCRDVPRWRAALPGVIAGERMRDAHGLVQEYDWAAW